MLMADTLTPSTWAWGCANSESGTENPRWEQSGPEPHSSDSAHGKEQCVNQNCNIHEEGAIPNIVKVILNIFVDMKGSVGAQLPETGYAGNHLEPLPVLRVVALNNEGHFR